MATSSSNTKGYLIIALHAHLPYIRYPEHESHLEERWLYEAITETYIPLLDVFNCLLNDKTDFRITLSLSPTLVEMFNDPLLMERYKNHIGQLIELTEKEIFRTRKDSAFRPLAKMYHEKFLKIKYLFDIVYRKDLTAAFSSLQGSGKIEIITSAATHAYLPALMNEPRAVRAQLALASEHSGKFFGKKTSGIWLPECGFAPGIDAFVKDAGFSFFFLESHGVLNSIPKSRYSIYAPVRTPAGAVAFSRDAESSKEVWSSVEGYPGDFDYRDFYRDIGFDLDHDYVKPYLPGDTRTFTGIKYYRITGKTEDKRPYNPSRALQKTKIHASHFIRSREEQILMLHDRLRTIPVITAAYDAELFGHWWFEGPQWLDFFFRKSALLQNAFRFTTPSEYLSENSHLETVMPSASSWGNQGYSANWLDSSNAWIYRHLHRAARVMSETAGRNMNAGGITRRALTQAARELLLAQASDWAFMMKTGNASAFAEKKFREHIQNFFLLSDQITAGEINNSHLMHLEEKNALFSDLDYRIYAGTHD